MKTSYLVFILIVVAGVIGWTEYVKRNPAERFYGIGQSDTRPFTVSDKWEISWSCVGPTKIALQSTQVKSLVPITTTSAPTMGSSYQTSAGEYTLHVTGSWPWMISVVNVGAENVPSSAPASTTAAPAVVPEVTPTPTPVSTPVPAPAASAAPSSTNTP